MTSFAILGAVLGSIFIGPVSDRIGRKKPVIIADIFFTIGAVFMYFSPNFGVLLLGRIIVGVF